jgi:C1A family cysteine protease
LWLYGLQNLAYKNKIDQAAASKRHYEKHKDKIKDRSKKRNKRQKRKNQEYIRAIKEASSCVDCGESNSVVLDFDHVKGEKVSNISIQKEIDKCEVRCSNCHRIATAKRRNEKRNS